LAILAAQEYLEDRVELPVLFAGFATQVGVRNGFKLSNQGRQGSLLHGPYLSLREPSFIRMESSLEPSRFNTCSEIYSRFTSPKGKFALNNFAINSSRVQRDISVSGNPLFQSLSTIGKFSRTEECTTIAPETDENPLWRSKKIWAQVPKTSQLELRHLVSSNETPFAITSTTAISKALAHYENAQMLQTSLLARFFGRPDFVEPFVRFGGNNDRSGASKQIMSAALLGEYDGGGYRVNRSQAEGLIGDVRYVSAVPAAHHDSGVVTPNGWLISDSETKQGARVYDQVLSFKSSAQQPVGALRVLMSVKQAKGSSPSFALSLTNEVTKKSANREFNSAGLTRDGAGNLWAALKLDAEISPDETHYRFTVSHRGGSYEISKVVFLSDKRQSSRELVVPAIPSESSAKTITHRPFALEADDRVVQSLRMEGSLTFSIPTVQRASLLPVVDLLKPQTRIVNTAPSHYNFLTATLSEDGKVKSERALSTAFKLNVGPTEIIARSTTRSVSCSLPYCAENICDFPEVCTANFGAIPERERRFATLNFEQPLTRNAREIQAKLDLAGLVSKQDLTGFRYTISKESVPEVPITRAAYADMFGGLDASLGRD
ncbi:MAG: hypothetical protein RL326_16, partial [Pseudomonadota bacterium]